MYGQIKATAAWLVDRTRDFCPETGIVLGTGLGGFTDHIDTKFSIPYSDIPGFPVSTVEGHQGRLIFGTVSGRRVIAMQGRFHYYEGYTMAQVTLGVRVMKLLGIEQLFVSNAAGGLNETFRVGDLMIITDHINLMPNPLIGKNLDEFGPRFPDMHGCYDPALIESAQKLGHGALKSGVYVASTGPTYETQAEYRYLRTIGGDATGMSTVPEVIVARQMGLPVFGVSVITNVGEGTQIGDHEDVQRQGKLAGERMSALFIEMIKNL